MKLNDKFSSINLFEIDEMQWSIKWMTIQFLSKQLAWMIWCITFYQHWNVAICLNHIITRYSWKYIKEIMSYFITSMICFTIKYYSKWTKLLWQFFALIDFRYKRRKLYERIRYLLYCWNLRILFATVAEVNQMLINQHSLCAIVTWLYLAKFNFCNIKL